jgi:hypothetical protein
MMKMKSLPLAGAFMLALHALPAAAEDECAAQGMRLVRETATAWHCVKIQLPVISPGFFVSEDEVAFARSQLAELALKKKRYQDQLAALGRTQGGLEMAASDLNTIRHEVVMDNMAQTLNVVSWAAGDVIQEPQRSAVLTQINVMKAYVNAAASAHASPDSARRFDKAVDAAANFKNIAVDLLATLPPEQAAAFKRASDTLPKMVRISQRYVDTPDAKKDWTYIAAQLDDGAAIVGDFVGVLKATRSTVHIVGGEVVLWNIERSKASLDDAFVRNQTARRYYLQKIGENEELQEFYRERIRRAQVR